MTIKELRQAAKEKGIKYFSRMNSTELCELLVLPLIRNQTFENFVRDKIKVPVVVIFTDKENGETQEFKSIYEASKNANVNPGLMSYVVSKKKEIRIGEKTFLVSKKV